MPKIIENLSRKLLDEARRQIRESGYSALNIRTVAKNCGVSVGTVYNYYPSKDALVAGFLLEDWMERLSAARAAAEREQSAAGVLELLHGLLSDFLTRYDPLFQSASASVPAPPRRYHRMLRDQLAEILLPVCPDRFTADFAAEALLTWTAEGEDFRRVREPILKIIHQ